MVGFSTLDDEASKGLKRAVGVDEVADCSKYCSSNQAGEDQNIYFGKLSDVLRCEWSNEVSSCKDENLCCPLLALRQEACRTLDLISSCPSRWNGRHRRILLFKIFLLWRINMPCCTMLQLCSNPSCLLLS